jgi:two-component system, NarL family, sensor kinase
MPEKDVLAATFLVITSIVIILLTSFFIIAVFRYQRRHVQYTNSLQEVKDNHEIELLRSQIEIQEQTFSNIAQEIHDNVGQKLSFAKLKVTVAQKNHASQELNAAENILGSVLETLRNMSRMLSSDFVLQNGLKHAIETEVTQIQQLHIFNISSAFTGDVVFMEDNQELMLFRIVQEALQNIIKHAKATTVNINLHFDSGNIHLTITDNGIGFNTATKQTGLGIINIQKRAAMLGGEAIFISGQAGTSYQIKVPIHEQKANQ